MTILARSPDAEASQFTCSSPAAAANHAAIAAGRTQSHPGRAKTAGYLGLQTTAECAHQVLARMRQGLGGVAAAGPAIGQPAAHTKVAAARLDLARGIKQAEAGDHVPTVAIDLDGTLSKMYEKYDPATIEDPRPGAQKALRDFQRRGWRIIVHTVRGDKQLIKDWLHKHDIPYDYVNENPDQPEDASDKVLADVYIDDRSVDARPAWRKVTDSVLDRVEKAAELAHWQQVPGLVRTRFKEADQLKRTIGKIIKRLPIADPGYGYVFWNPDTKTIWAVLSDSDEEQTTQKWHNALKAIQGVNNVRIEAEWGPHGDDDWIRIKRGASMIQTPYNWLGKATGGPSPLTNTIVNSLLGAGLGYGAGWLGEQLLPEDYVERGTLRRNLALAGAGVGMLPGAWQAYSNHRISQTAGKPLGVSSLWTPDSKVPMSPHEMSWNDSLYDGTKQGWEIGLPAPNEWFMQSAEEFVKKAFSGIMGSQGVPLHDVPVDAFNQAVWNDVHKGLASSQSNPWGTRSPYGENKDTLHTPPIVGAAVTGVVSGIQEQYGNPSLLSPAHFISGLAGAGVDLATARMAGGMLGALGGLTPAAQDKLQNMGLWGGFMRGVAKSVFGL